MDLIAHVRVEIAVPFTFEVETITGESDDAHQERVLEQRSNAAKHAEGKVVDALRKQLPKNSISDITVTLVEEAQ
jgi:hypothetical protein